MRVPQLKPQTRTRLLALGLLLIGFSTAAGLNTPLPGEALQDVARSHAGSTAQAEPCHEPG